MLNTTKRLKSYICHGRATPGQKRILQDYWAKSGIVYPKEIINFDELFGRSAPLHLEIGFGFGHSLLAVAKLNPQHNYVGIEAHRPGIGSVCMGIEQDQLTNLRIIQSDAVEVLEKCVTDDTLSGIQIFFPDPWPKRRHQPRRLIQPEFIKLVVKKLKQGGEIHLATDWEDYALHMMKVMSNEPQLINTAGEGQYSPRSAARPVITKYEGKAIREKRNIAELHFIKR